MTIAIGVQAKVRQVRAREPGSVSAEEKLSPYQQVLFTKVSAMLIKTCTLKCQCAQGMSRAEYDGRKQVFKDDEARRDVHN